MRLTKSNLAEVVQQTRIANGMTQAQLAERAACSQRLISELERGSAPRFDKVIDIFEALNVHITTQAAPIDAHKEIALLEERVLRSMHEKPKRPKLVDYL